MNSSETTSSDILVTYDECTRIYTIALNSEPERDIVDRLHRTMSDLVSNTSQQVVKIILDLSHPTLRLTPYGQQMGDIFYASIPPEQQVSVAVCIADNTLNRLFHIFMRPRLMRYPHIHERLFTCKEKAKVWLHTES